MPTPRISVVILTHNRPRMLARAIDSVHQQTFNDVELVVVVNDSQPEIQNYLATKGESVRCSYLDRNYGVTIGRNVGIDMSGGELILFLDDDAELHSSQTLEQIAERFAEQPDLGVLALNVLRGDTGKPDFPSVPFVHKKVPANATPACYFAGGACVIRRKVIEQLGKFDGELFFSGEELDMSYAILDAGLAILFDPAITVFHYRQPASPAKMYYQVRNRPLIALRHLPLAHFATHCLAWWAWGLYQGTKHGGLRSVAAGIKDCIKRVPAVWRSRKPICNTTLRFLAIHHGRRWY